MKCKLCEEKDELVESHIIPKLFFRPIMKSAGGVQTIDTEKRILFKHPKFQSGIKHSLLCRECEEKFSKLEDFLRKSFYGNAPDNIKPLGFFYHPEHERVWVKSVNTQKLLKLLYSILWRASVSEHDFFSKVKIDNQLEEDLRKILLEDECEINFRLVETLVYTLKLEGDSLVNMVDIQSINEDHRGNRKGYRFIFGGFMIQFYVAGDEFDERFRILVAGSGSDVLYGAEINSEEHINFMELAIQISELKNLKR